jgi:hypothetical protein
MWSTAKIEEGKEVEIPSEKLAPTNSDNKLAHSESEQQEVLDTLKKRSNKIKMALRASSSLERRKEPSECTLS